MDCGQARTRIFQMLDGELSPDGRGELESHLVACRRCAREQRLLYLPRRLGRALPPLEPSRDFYDRLRARLEGSAEPQEITIWQILLGLSRHIVPALASVTVVLVSVFLYTAVQAPSVDLQAYDVMFVGERTPSLAEDLTDEGALRSLLEWEHGEVGAETPAQPADAR
jgi:anti-sigma factor RsiW